MALSTRERDRLSIRGTAKFGLLTALCAIFIDAVIAHGLFWENDPYWTYWITKTFLIATVFGLGTAWFGTGVARGAVITLVHLVLQSTGWSAWSAAGRSCHRPCTRRWSGPLA